MTPYVTRCRRCGAELRGEDAVGGWCAAPRCAEQADAVSPAGSRVTDAGLAEQARQTRADTKWASVIVADLDAAEAEREQRKRGHEFTD